MMFRVGDIVRVKHYNGYLGLDGHIGQITEVNANPIYPLMVRLPEHEDPDEWPFKYEELEFVEGYR